MAEDEASSHYNSLQVDLHANVRNLQLQFGYTLSRAIDSSTSVGSGGDLQALTNPYAGAAYNVGPSLFDRTNIAFANFVYQIPFLRNSSNRLLKATAGGWALSGVVTMESGAPINLGVSGQNASSVIPFSGNRPDLTGSFLTRSQSTNGSTPRPSRLPLALRAQTATAISDSMLYAVRVETTGTCRCSRISSSAKRGAVVSSSASRPSTHGTIPNSRAMPTMAASA